MTFRLVVDGWYYGLIVFLVAFYMLVAIGLLLEEGIGTALLVISVISVPFMLPVWLLFSTFYRIERDDAEGSDVLKITSGPFRWTVPLREITSMQATRLPLSYPALSLDRIEIVYGKGRRILISPENRSDFVSLINEKTGKRFTL